MQVHYYPPFSPPDPAAALEDHLRRAYSALDPVSPEPLCDAVRRLTERTTLQAKPKPAPRRR